MGHLGSKTEIDAFRHYFATQAGIRSVLGIALHEAIGREINRQASCPHARRKKPAQLMDLKRVPETRAVNSRATISEGSGTPPGCDTFRVVTGVSLADS